MLKPKYTYLFLITLFFNIVFSQDKASGWKINENQTTIVQTEVLTVINDKILRNEVLSIISNDKIENILILKKEQAVEKYGNKGTNGAIEISTKNISKKELSKLYKSYAEAYLPNTKGKIKTITGKIVDCEEVPIKDVKIMNLNAKTVSTSDSLGNYSIEARKNDVLLVSKMGFEGKKVLISTEKKLNFSLKATAIPQGNIYRKPIIYLYPTEKLEVEIKLNVNGKLLTTFPKYDESWKIIAEPNGQIFDTTSKRNYSSLFWDADVQLPKEHYQYKDGFVISKEKLTDFFIEKLEHIGLNNRETNEFIQFWLPILEQNNYNFIHFRINDECNKIAELNVNPKPQTTIRVYMEYYGLDDYTTIKAQILPTIERKGFTLIEWGGADISNSLDLEDFKKLTPLTEHIILRCKRKEFEAIKSLYIIDGKISSKLKFNKLNPAQIKKIKTLNGTEGAALYGQDGVNGVFIIETKKLSK